MAGDSNKEHAVDELLAVVFLPNMLVKYTELKCSIFWLDGKGMLALPCDFYAALDIAFYHGASSPHLFLI
eukprot:13302820-Ditylum_brightwellii.AAC.1